MVGRTPERGLSGLRRCIGRWRPRDSITSLRRPLKRFSAFCVAGVECVVLPFLTVPAHELVESRSVLRIRQSKNSTRIFVQSVAERAHQSSRVRPPESGVEIGSPRYDSSYYFGVNLLGRTPVRAKCRRWSVLELTLPTQWAEVTVRGARRRVSTGSDCPTPNLYTVCRYI